VLKKVDASTAVKRVLAGEKQGAGSSKRPSSSAKMDKGGSSSNLEKTGSTGKLGGKPTDPSNKKKVSKPRPESSKVAPHAQEEETQEEPAQDEEEEQAPPPVASVSGLAGKRMARPASARPPPPKIRANKVMAQEAPAAAPVIFQEVKKAEEEDDSFIIVAADEEVDITASSEDLNDGNDEVHGGLVRKILETKREFNNDKDKKESDVSLLPKDKQIAKREIDALRDNIQQLCRSTNPLAKALDYIQEDVDGMNKELEYWKSESGKWKVKLEEEVK
jgi:TRAF3-interacting protein 1